jgi:threonine dehydratase
MPQKLDYLKRILTARVYDVAVETALDPARHLSQRLHNHVLLKREDQQPVFSFKLRGAYNKMAQLDAEQLARGVICASAGNHAQGVALSARKLGTKALIVMPVTTPKVKIDAVSALGGTVVLEGESYSDAYQHALKLQAEQGLVFVHPAPAPGADRSRLRGHRRRRLDRRCGQLHQGGAAGNQGDRGADARLRCHAPIGAGGGSGAAP